ncbi:MAG: response regulator transcription factor [Verrucomicrobia bacterium]|nr:response regulator transcription factor [Verrucomicrobiota bacterium]
MQNVLIVEDEVLLRDLLCDLISNQPDLNVIATTGDGSEGCRMCLQLKPDILVCDIQLPGLNGIEILQRVKSELPDTKVLALSGVFNIARIKRVLMAKPDGIVEKASGLAVMEKALHAVASGHVFYSPEIIRKMPELLSASEHDGDLESLTPREREVLQLIAEGNTTKEIADKLGISVRTPMFIVLTL